MAASGVVRVASVDGDNGLPELDLEAMEQHWACIDEVFSRFEEIELEAFDAAFDECLTAQGLDLAELDKLEDEWIDDAAGTVFVESEDGETFVSFGEGDGSITVTKSGGEITVSSEGDVMTETLDWVELDEPFEICETELADRAPGDVGLTRALGPYGAPNLGATVRVGGAPNAPSEATATRRSDDVKGACDEKFLQ